MRKRNGFERPQKIGRQGHANVNRTPLTVFVPVKSAHGSKWTSRTGPLMSGVRGRPEVAFRIRQERV